MSHQIEILIRSAEQSDQQRWDQQCARIRRSGAQFESNSRNWRLHLDLTEPSGTAAALGELFTAAQTFGTTVLPINPETEMPAVSVLEEHSTENAHSADHPGSA